MFDNIPPVVKNLLIINALMLLATISLEHANIIDLNNYLGLHFFGSTHFNPFQYISYMFMHGSIGHLFMNMFSLWMFGRVLEQVWGAKKFLTYYLITGIGAALIHTLVVYFQLMPQLAPIDAFLDAPTLNNLNQLIGNYTFTVSNSGESMLNAALEGWRANPQSVEYKAKIIVLLGDYRQALLDGPTVVGASGSVYGLLLAFGMIFPNMQIQLLIPPIPLKAKYFVLIFGFFEFFSGLSNNPGDNVAHFAHLGGMLFGFIILRLWRQKRYQ